MRPNATSKMQTAGIAPKRCTEHRIAEITFAPSHGDTACMTCTCGWGSTITEISGLIANQMLAAAYEAHKRHPKVPECAS